MGPEDAVGHAELGGSNEGTDELPHYFVGRGDFEQSTGHALGDQSIAVGKALGPAGEVGEEGDPRQALVLPDDLAGGRVHLQDPGVAEPPSVGAVVQQQHVFVLKVRGMVLVRDDALPPIPGDFSRRPVHQRHGIEDAEADQEGAAVRRRGEIVGPSPVELAGEAADGALLLVGLHPRAVEAARRRLEVGAARAGRSLDGFQTIFIAPTTVSDDGPAARRFPQQWFRPDQPYLKYPSNTNLVWLREAGIDLADDFVPENISDSQAEAVCDAFGLFGTPDECLARLRKAKAESGIDHVFIFPTHTQEGGYDMPRAVDAFRDMIIPGLAAP